MSSVIVSLLIFACVFCGSMLGLVLRAVVPPHHRDGESKDLVKIGMGFVGTMAALLLGLLVASTKSSYDAQKSEVTELSSKFVFLDRILAHYGPETKEPREQLRAAVTRIIDQIWPEDSKQVPQLDPTKAGAEGIYEMLEGLAPATDAQRTLKAQAIATATDIGKLRWQLFQQSGSSISKPLVAVVVSWLTIIFIGFGYCAPKNATVVVTLLVCALSVSSALFLILEMDQPFRGVIRIQSDTLRGALNHLGK